MIRFCCATLLILSLAMRSPAGVLDEFTTLRQKGSAARKSSDTAGYLDAVLKIQQLLNNAPDAIEAAARAYATAGDTAHALESLDRFASMGQADEKLLSGDPGVFTSISKLPEYQRILARFAENKKPVSRSELAFTLPDPGMLAEDIDYDPASRSFFITSVLRRKILRLTSDGKTSDFAASPSRWPMLAIKVDSQRGLVWATEVGLDGFTVAPKSDWGRSAVLCFNAKTGALLHRVEGPAHSALGDLALAPNGDAIVSDGNGGGVYRVTGDRLKLINGQDFISPQTGVMLPGGNRMLVPDYVRGIALLQLDSGQVSWLNADVKSNIALNGVDGLYLYHGSMILTQNGATPERVMRVALDPAHTHATSEEIIEKATATLGDPTHGVVVGGAFFYIANSGWDTIDEHGNLKAGKVPTVPRIMRSQLL